LGKIRCKQGVASLVALLEDADEDTSLRGEVARALGEIGSKRAVAPLVAILEDAGEDTSLKEEAMQVLGKIGGQLAVAALVAALEDDDITLLYKTPVQEKASIVLTQVGKAAVAALIPVLSGKNVAARHSAAAILCAIGDEMAVEPLIAILDDLDQDDQLRRKAAEALGRLGGTMPVETLIRAASADADYAVRCEAVFALGNIGSPEPADVLVRILRDSQSEDRIRGLAAQALGKIGSTSGVEPLTDVIRDRRESSWVKENAVWALGQIGDYEAAGALLKHLKSLEADWGNDGEDRVKGVIRALDKIGFLESPETSR
jgi:HEAT repeat protein